MPWFISTLQLVISVVVVAILWALGVEKKPKFSKKLFMSLIPAGFFHCVGHVSACVSFSLVAVSFSHIVKSAEPVYSVILGQLLFGISYPFYTWITLLPIIAGTSLSALKEISFTWAGFNSANISNLGMVFRNIYSKKNLGEFKDLHGISLYGLMSFVALLFCLPVALLVEGSRWKPAYQTVAGSIGHKELLKLIALAGILYHAYNQASYMVLDTGLTALGLSVGNVMKRVAVVVTSVMFFKNPVSPLNWFGSFVAIFGTYLYSVA